MAILAKLGLNKTLDSQKLQTHLPMCECIGCRLPAFNDYSIQAGPTIGPASSLTSLPKLSSNPNATAKIYLDFDGHTTSGTYWNNYKGGADIVTSAYSTDGDTTTFSNEELVTIEEIWKRVAEDYAPFNVDVTTVDPGNLSDTNNMRAVIGGSWRDWFGSSAGGVAYLDSWQWSGDTPAFIFEENLWNGYAPYTAEAISHEVGHTLGLRHQSSYDANGNKTAEYNQGGDGWAPIMGVSYYQTQTTWHNGPNSDGSTSYQDDMAVITQAANGFGYRADDIGNTNATATLLSGDTTVSGSGIISTTSDVDVFSFTTGSGSIALNVNVAPYGPNLDVIAELRDSNNTTIASSNPSDQLNASINTSVAAGNYYLHVKSNGLYGRVGQYTIGGTINPMPIINGTDGNDSLVGTANSEIINGYGGDDTLVGNAGNDTINGEDGNDILNGGTGDDNLSGGAGNDTYYIDSAGDAIAVEVSGGGTDTVNSTLSYTLAAELENLTLSGTDSINGTGNALNNTINGNNGNNVLSGEAGSDTLKGNAGNDTLIGSDGDDILNGGTGDDNLSGGAGNDTYYIDSVGDAIAAEVFGGGIDKVNSTISYTLAAELENLTLNGTDSLNGTGNALNNTINGNSGNNVLSGEAGNDNLSGGAGNDTLIGSDGDDILNGGTGDDNLSGGAGNDTYYIDSVGDAIAAEVSGGGIDKVNSTISYTLAAELENLTLNGTDSLNGTGNALNNIISGNAGNNVLSGEAGNDNLSGGAGDDTLIGGDGSDTLSGGTGDDNLSGGAGNDTYQIDSAGDAIAEVAGGGIDRVNSTISYTLAGQLENLTLNGIDSLNGTGNALNNTINGNGGNNVLTGEAGNDTLTGNAGDDTLIGSAGNDVLTGSAGSDRFVFSTGSPFTTAALGVDRITDFVTGVDRVVLSKQTFSAIASAAGDGFSVAAEFATVTTDAAAATSKALIVYNTAKGNLFYNQNGATAGLGEGALFATLTTKPVITTADFSLI